MEFTITITGTHPVIMHSARLSDPLDPIAKAIKEVSSKRTKTDDDHLEMARLEFIGSLYCGDQTGPYMPGENLQRCLVDAAKINKLGVKATRGIFIATDYNALQYEGPRDILGLWADEQFRTRDSVKVGMARVMRCRPIFRNWSFTAEGILDTEQLNLADLRNIANNAGRLIGLGDWRPRFGRFTAEVTTR